MDFDLTNFFKKNELLIERYCSRVAPLNFDGDEGMQLRRNVVVDYLRMAASESSFGSTCQVTLSGNHQNIIDYMSYEDIERGLVKLSYVCLKMAREHLINTGRYGDVEARIFNFFSHRNPSLTDEDYREIDFAMTLQPVWHVNHLLETYGKTLIRADDAVKERVDAHEKLFEKWKTSIDEVQRNLEAKREYIDKLKADFNFVGLSKAFSEMEDKANTSRSRHFWSLLFLSALILAPILISGGLLLNSQYGHEPLIKEVTWDKYVLIAPVILSIEVVLIYFFRIVLRNYQSLRALGLQLQQRLALCAFIQQYIEFKKENHDIVVDKFEALIFSGLTEDPEKIPSTFDGMDQLIKLISAARRGHPGD